MGIRKGLEIKESDCDEIQGDGEHLSTQLAAGGELWKRAVPCA